MAHTPAQLRVLLHVFYIKEPFEYTQTVSDAVALLKAQKLIEPDMSPGNYCRWHTTDRGDAYVKMLCMVPMPVQVTIFKNPETGERIE